MTINIRRIAKIGEGFSMFLILIALSIVIFLLRKSLIRAILSAPLVLSIFTLSFVSCISILPIPYTYILFLLAATLKINPILTSIVSGIGAGLGEAVAWFIGRGSKKVLEDTEYVTRLNVLLKYLEKRASWAIPIFGFIFALTPLPDKLLYLPLGLLGFSVWKILPFTILGKIVMTYIVVFVGREWGSIIGETLGSRFSDEVMFIITIILLLIIMALFVFVKWDRILLRFISNNSQ